MLLRQTLSYLPAQLIGPLVQFVSVIVWTHWLPPAAYGVVALVLAAQELVFQLGLSWWSHYTMRYYAALTTEAERRRYQAVENAVLALSAVVQTLVSFAVLAATTAVLSPELALATAGFAVSRSLTTHLCERARASQRVGAYTLAQTVGPVLGFAASLAALQFWAATPAAALAGLALGQIVVLPVLWRALGLGHAMRLEAATLRSALTYGLPLLVTGAIGWVSLNGVRVIVEHIDGAAAVGLLSVGWGLGHRVVSVAAMLVTAAAFPLAVRRLAEAGRGAALDQVARNGTLLIAVLAPATAGLVWVTPPAVGLLVGAEFQAATLAVLPLAVAAGAIRTLRVHFADQVFLLLERPRLLLALNTVEAVAVTLLATYGLIRGGLPGACLGCILGYGLGAILCFGAAARAGLPLPWRPVLRISLAVAAMLGSLALGATLTDTLAGAIGLAVQVAIGGVAYIAALALLFRAELPRLHPAAILAR